MMAFERWDVVTALFPFTEAGPQTPTMLVLSPATFNIQHGRGPVAARMALFLSPDLLNSHAARCQIML